MTNLIQNPGFEELGSDSNVFENWINFGTPGSLIDNTIFPHSGIRAAQINVNTQLQQTIPTLIPDTQYELSFWISPIDAVGIVTVGFGNGAIFVPVLTINTSELEPNVYTLETGTFTIPPGFGTLSLEFFTFNLSSGSVLIDDVSVIPVVVCYSGESMVYARNIKTGEVKYIEVKNIYSNDHEVFSITKNQFIPIKQNIVSGPTSNIRIIKKNELGEDKPNNDLYITPGHKIVIDGIAIKVRNIPQAKRVKKRTEMVYSICVDENEPILINNLSVIAWGFDEWIKYAGKKNIIWKNNQSIN